MTLDTAEWGAILIAVSVTAYLLGKLPTLRSIGIFLGVVLVGVNGHVIAFASRVAEILGRLTSVVLVWGLGITAGIAGVVIIAVLGFIMIHDWLPRNAAKKRTFWISLAMGLVVAAGATGVAALDNFRADLTTGVTQVTSGGTGTGLGG
jgi:uncharacterized BrkB/YihY/UPF0761 family membrane protein